MVNEGREGERKGAQSGLVGREIEGKGERRRRERERETEVRRHRTRDR